MYQQIDVAKTSLLSSGGSGIKEYYIPLWVYSSGIIQVSAVSPNFIPKGSTTHATSISSATTLHNLSSGWKSSQQFALEISIYCGNASYTANAQLWDMTSNSAVPNSQVSTSTISPTLLRSNSCTLTPGHAYGINFWNSGGGNASTSVSKAHLVALF